MTEKISAGDLVVVVRADHSCAIKTIGMIFTVKEIPTHHPGIYCIKCKQSNIALPDSPIAKLGGGRAFPLHWLKRIPPLSELESIDEQIKEPA